MRLANIRNGLAFPHDDVCFFQSNHGHQAKIGYFRIDAMPYKAVIHLLKGGSVEIIDATRRNKTITDGQKFGVATWCLVFNRAIEIRKTKVCPWQTVEMERIANLDIHDQLKNSIRKLVHLYGFKGPAIIGSNVHLTCHQKFIADDNVRRLRRLVAA